VTARRWFLDRGKFSVEQKERPRYPSEVTIAEALTLYAVKHASGLEGAPRVGFAITRLLEWWGDRRVDAIRPESYVRYVQARVDHGLKVGTAARELIVLRAAVRHAEKNGYLTAAPFVKLPPKQPGRERWLTRGEAARLLWECRREPKARLHLPLFVMIALHTGARRGAILGLRWTQVDLVRGRVDFNEPSRPITNKRRPVIPIPRQLLWFLRAAQQRINCPHVISYNGERVGSIKRSLASACQRAGLPGVTSHVFRHTCGTWLAQAGVDLYQIAGWLGHTNERTTELYAHHHPDHFEAAKRAMERRQR
jgi:integrase